MNILGFLAAIFILVLVHELGHFLAAKLNKVKVEEFGIGFPPSFLRIKYGETVYSLNLIPLGGFVRVYGEEKEVKKDKNRAFVFKKPWQKITILAAGVLGNFLLAWLLISYLFTQGVPVPVNKVIVEKVEKNSPAQKAGIKKGDIIMALTYKNETIKIKSTKELVQQVKKYAGKEVELSIKRNGEVKRIKVVPRKNPPKGQGALGIVITSFEVKSYPWYQAPFKGLVESLRITGRIIVGVLSALGDIITFKRADVQVTGPIGIAKITSDAIKLGKNAFLELLALLSLNLAVINLFPFPALDGGRIALVLYEWKSGRRVNKEFERKLNTIGFVLLILLAIIISIYDVKRFF